MAYILFANPAILSAGGVPLEPAIAATAAAAAVCSLLMGLLANFPMALAPGMGLNAVIAFQIVPAAGSWQVAMGLVVLDGLVVLALVLLGLREAMMLAIPADLRRAIGGGIGLFLALIGAVNARLVVVPESTLAGLARDPTSILPPLAAGTLRSPEVGIALAGIVVIGIGLVLGIRGAIVLGILLSTGVALLVGVAKLPEGAWLGIPRFETVGQADVIGALRLSLVPMLLALVLVDFFDTLGTASAVAEESGLQDERGNIPGLRRILEVDAVSASIGGFFGASSVTSYVESASGVAEGARTGLHSVVVAALFALAMFAAPVAGIVPASATAAALIVVGFLMCQQVTRIDFRKVETALPAFVLLVAIPFTYSISHGIGYGFITFVAIHLLSGRWRSVHPLMYAAAGAFLAFLITE
jgi:AGZA family xanthine/uracil permease-like MFS transporter